MSVLTLLIRNAGALAVLLAVVLGTYSIAAAPSVQASSLGVRGRKRVRALDDSPLFDAIEPLLRWLGARVAPLLGEGARRGIDRQILLAGDFWGLLPEELIALSIVSGVAGGGTGFLVAAMLEKGPLYPLIGGALGIFLPYIELSGRQHERSRRLSQGLPYIIDLLALALSAGLDFPGAVREVVEKSSNPDDPLIEELSLVLSELEVGKTRKAALSQLAERAPGESVRDFVSSVIQAEERGNPLSHILQIQAESSRRSRSVNAEEAAAKASVKIIMPLMLAFVAVLLLIAAPMALQIQDAFGGQ